MSFWDLSDGEDATKTGTEYEVPGGNMQPIPGNSDVLATIKNVEWKTVRDSSDRYVEIQWSVLEPEAYKNRVVFHKLWVKDLDPQAKTEQKAKEKRDKARRMLASIDANAGGRLMRSHDEPTDDSLALALKDKAMVIKVMLWEMPDREKPGHFISGNWVSAVKPKGSETNIGTEMPTPNATGGASSDSDSGGTYGGGGLDLKDDEIPW